MELIRNAIRVGNSAGVLLPKEWLNSRVKVILQPMDLEREIINILIEEKILKVTLGVYLVGSYARGEETIDSDVDVLVITKDTSKKIKKGKYEIICLTQKEIENDLEKNTLPILAMLKEAKPILNSNLIDKYLSSKLTRKNLGWHIETTKSAMKIVGEEIKLSTNMKTNVSDASAYSLILRLRTLYIIDCIRKNKMWSKKDFLNLVKKTSGSEEAYERYLSAKDKKSMDYKLPVETAEKLMNYINKKVVDLEKQL